MTSGSYKIKISCSVTVRGKFIYKLNCFIWRGICFRCGPDTELCLTSAGCDCTKTPSASLKRLSSSAVYEREGCLSGNTRMIWNVNLPWLKWAKCCKSQEATGLKIKCVRHGSNSDQSDKVMLECTNQHLSWLYVRLVAWGTALWKFTSKLHCIALTHRAAAVIGRFFRLPQVPTWDRSRWSWEETLCINLS